MKGLFQQAWYDMRNQPVIGIVTVVGTALSIFLIMIVVMMQAVKVEPFQPEGNRDRVLYGKFIHLRWEKGADGSASADFPTTKRLYCDLNSAEATTVYTNAWQGAVGLPGKPARMRYVMKTDADFWRVFDYRFVAGAPYGVSDPEATSVVVSESVARENFGTADVVGQEILVFDYPRRIVGVVADASPLAREAYSEIFLPLTESDRKPGDAHFGQTAAAILARGKGDFPAIRAEVDARKRAFSRELAEEGLELIDHHSPFTQEEVICLMGSNGDSQAGSARRERYLLYALLLLVPAINLSAMTQSRLRRRRREIGVRRAFVASRAAIIRAILAENLLVTLAGGLLGLGMSALFGYFFSDMIFGVAQTGRHVDVTLGMILNMNVFLTAMLFCFLLNLLSSGLPAWRASRVDPVDAINSRNI